MTGLPSVRLPPLENNRPLKLLLWDIDARGEFTDDDLTKLLDIAGNISADEDKAIRAVLFADHVEAAPDAEAFPRFVRLLELEGGCRNTASWRQIRSAIARALTGMGTGAVTGVTGATALGMEAEVTMATIGALLGLYIGFRQGAYNPYGVND